MRKRSSIRNERGQTMTEFALILPLMLLLVFSVIQFGFVFNDYLSLTDAVRAGARKAAVSRHESCQKCVTEARVRQAADDLDQDQLAVDVVASPGWEPGADVTVTAKYPYSLNLLGVVFKAGVLTSKTTERVE
jgi:Flp pilus assembly protein TadG